MGGEGATFVVVDFFAVDGADGGDAGCCATEEELFEFVEVWAFEVLFEGWDSEFFGD